MALSEELGKPNAQPTEASVSTDKQPRTRLADIPSNPQQGGIAAQTRRLAASAFSTRSLDEMAMAEEFATLDSPPPDKKPKTKQSTIPFNPQQGILKHLLAETTHPVAFKIKGKPDCNPIYIYPEKKVFYCLSPLEKLAPYFVIDKNLVTTPLSITELNKAVKKQSLTPQPLSYLIWYAGFSLSQGRMLLGHTDQDFFYLKKIPYRDANTAGYLPLAVYLLENITNLEIAAKETGLALDKVIDFYNGCYLIGLIQRATETGLVLELAHDYFSADYIDGLVAKAMDYELNRKPPKPEKQTEKQSLMDKFINSLKN